MYSIKRVMFVSLVVVSSLQICLAAIGDPCISGRCPNNEQNAYCKNNICSCEVEQAISADKQKCLEAALGVGQSCVEDVQCTHLLTGWAYCDANKQCACKEGGSYSNGRCQKNKLLGDRCVTSQECSHIPNSHCSSIAGPIDTMLPVCACTKLYVPSTNNSACLPSAPFILAPCELDLQCQSLGDNTTCLNSMCQCKEANHFNIDATPKSMCVYNRGISEPCERGDCYLVKDGEKQNIHCSVEDGTCVCQNEFPSTPGQESCNTASGPLIFSTVWMLVAVIAAKATF